MLNMNLGGLDRHLDNAGPKAVTRRAPAISGLIGSSPNFLAVVEQLGIVAPVVTLRVVIFGHGRLGLFLLHHK